MQKFFVFFLGGGPGDSGQEPMSGVLRVQIFVWSVKDISASDAVLQDVGICGGILSGFDNVQIGMVGF